MTEGGSVTDLVEWLTAQLDHDEWVANGAVRNSIGPDWTAAGLQSAYDARVDDHIALHDPARVLRQVAAHRRILAQVASWTHRYCEDTWYSCGLAVEYGSTEPGSGCARDDHIGTCTCGLKERQMRMLSPLASIYAERPGYDPAWAVE